MKVNFGDAFSCIIRILSVIENSMDPGKYDNTRFRRHSDCFVYVTGGECMYSDPDGTYTVKKGDVMYLSKNSSYKMNVSRKYSFIYVNFDFEDDGNYKRLNSFTPKNTASMYKLFDGMLSAHKSGEAKHKATENAILYGIYSELLDSLESSSYYSSSSFRLLKPAEDHIHSHYADVECAGVNEFAKMCGISETHLRRLFVAKHGVSPMKYISSLRLKRAEELLIYGTLNISSVAENSGYGDRYYFSRIFKAETGMSPYKYRKRYGIGKT